MPKITFEKLHMIGLYRNQVTILDRMIQGYAQIATSSLGVDDPEGFVLDYLMGVLSWESLCTALNLELELNESETLLEAA